MLIGGLIHAVSSEARRAWLQKEISGSILGQSNNSIFLGGFLAPRHQRPPNALICVVPARVRCSCTNIIQKLRGCDCRRRFPARLSASTFLSASFAFASSTTSCLLASAIGLVKKFQTKTETVHQPKLFAGAAAAIWQRREVLSGIPVLQTALR